MMKFKRVISASCALMLSLSVLPANFTQAYVIETETIDESILLESIIVPEGEPSEYGYQDTAVIDTDGNLVEDEVTGENLSVNSTLPVQYNSADEGNISTTEKNQGEVGICWTYSAINTAESSAIMQGLADTNVDFSEAHLAWYSYNSLTGDATDTTAGDGSNLGYMGNGGNRYDTIATLSRWSGVQTEEDYHHVAGDYLSAEFMDYSRYGGLLHLTDAEFIESNDTDAIKQAVIDHGCVEVAYYAGDDSLYYDTTNYAYYQNAATSVNHAVTVVGWDDNFSKTNFNSNCRPTTDGAWLIKGSWGSVYGDEGYYYISYEEPEMTSFTAYSFESADELDNNYQYDGSTTYNGLKFPNLDTFQFANVYTAKGNETLKSVGVKNATDGTGYTIKVNKVTGDDPDGVLVSTTTGTFDFAGYHTIDLTTPYVLTAGEKFSIVVQYDFEGSTDYFYCEGSGDGFASEAGQSFYRIGDSYTWNDLNGSYNNVCLKAFTVNNDSADKTQLGNLLDEYAGNTLIQSALLEAQGVYNDKNATQAEITTAVSNLKKYYNDKANVVLISSESEWNSFASAVAGGNTYAGKTVILTKDLDFSGKTFTVCGSTSSTTKYFYGVFDGGGHSISNVTVSSGSYTGLFTYLGNGSILRNLNTINCNITGYYAGGLVAINRGQIQNCVVTGSVTSTTSYAGAFVGYMNSGLITDCVSGCTTTKLVGTGLNRIEFSARTNTSTSNGFLTTASAMTDGSLAYKMNIRNNIAGNTKQWSAGDGMISAANGENLPCCKVTFMNGDDEYIRYTSADGTCEIPSVSDVTWEFGGEEFTSTSVVNDDITVNAKATGQITASRVQLSQSEYTYDGSAKVPTVTIDGLTQNVDYSISYSNNINAGTATVTITNLKDLTNVVTKNFVIRSKSIATYVATLSSDSFDYDGSAKTPSVTITGLALNTDYTVSYSNNISAGTATVTITGKGNYSGQLVKSFTIIGTGLESALVTLSATSYTYTGTTRNPTPTVVLNGVTLARDTDYTVSYSNNINVGTARITITGKGNYSGTINRNYSIVARNVSTCTVTLSATTYAYTGSARNTTPTVKYGSKTLVRNTDYKVSYSNNINVGTAKVTITGKGNYSGTVTKTYSVVKRAISSASVSTISLQYYTGKGISPSPKLTYNSKTLVKGTDYTLTYSNNVSTGKATLKITGKGNFSGTKSVYFYIAPKTQSPVTLSSTVKSKMTVKWTKDSTCTGYVIQYSTSSRFSSYKNVVVRGNSNVSKTITGLSTGKRYYVRIRAYKTISGKNYYGRFSSVKNIVVKK